MKPYLFVYDNQWKIVPDQLEFVANHSSFKINRRYQYIFKIYTFPLDKFTSFDSFQEFLIRELHNGKKPRSWTVADETKCNITLAEIFYEFGRNFGLVHCSGEKIDWTKEINLSKIPLYKMSDDEIENISDISSKFSNIYEMILPFRETILKAKIYIDDKIEWDVMAKSPYCWYYFG